MWRGGCWCIIFLASIVKGRLGYCGSLPCARRYTYGRHHPTTPPSQSSTQPPGPSPSSSTASSSSTPPPPPPCILNEATPRRGQGTPPLPMPQTPTPSLKASSATPHPLILSSSPPSPSIHPHYAQHTHPNTILASSPRVDAHSARKLATLSLRGAFRMLVVCFVRGAGAADER